MLGFGTILFVMVPKEHLAFVENPLFLEPFCLTWYQRGPGFLFHFFVILEPFYSSRVRNYLSRKEENMTKSFQDFKKEYLEELGSEAKEEYNKALEELKEEKQK